VFAFTQVATLLATTRRSPGSAGACSCSAHSGGLDGTPTDPRVDQDPDPQLATRQHDPAVPAYFDDLRHGKK
jgi:hypothetical protein